MKKVGLRSVYTIPLLISILLFLVLVFATLQYLKYKQGLWEKDVRSRVTEILISKKTKLEKALYSRVYYTKSVAAYVAIHPNISNEEFYNLANELIKNDSIISTMALSKDCVLGSIYPLEGHEAAIGLDLLEHPERKEIVEKTIETQKAFIAGPVELIEGGTAFISYTPIFEKVLGKEGRFWGVTDIVIYKDKLIEQAGLKMTEFDLFFALRGYNGSGNSGEAWWGKKEIFDESPVIVNIDLPYGYWELAAIPNQGWEKYYDQDSFLKVLLLTSSLIISILIALLLISYVKLRTNEREIKAILNSLDSLIIEFDKEGRYIKIPDTNEALLVDVKNKLLNKTVYEIFDNALAKQFHSAILQCLETKNLVTIEYPLLIDGLERWFTARITKLSENSVIFHAIDITLLKQKQEESIKSEKKLKELNATKDKFFSIIAHDLKSPLGSIVSMTNLLAKNYKEFDANKMEQWLMNINESSENLYGLLNNLLTWSQSQRDKIKYLPERINLSQLVNEVKTILLPFAFDKNISIYNQVDNDIFVMADKKMFETIFRNLLTNAIKFNNNNGTINVYVHILHNGKLQVVIEDNGIGLEKKTLNKLFKIDQNISTEGTNKEKGTGLGLILCKEFIDKHGEKIWVESEPGKGSKFIFTLKRVD